MTCRTAWIPLALASVACAEPSTAPDLGAVDVGFFDGGPGVDGCPPEGPYGVEEGDLLPAPALVDCDGNPYSLHSLCGKKAAWQFHMAGW